MGLTYIRATVANPVRPRRIARLRFLVDSGAHYSLVPASVLHRLGIKPTRTESFILADGTEAQRSLGEALFRLNGKQGTSPVIFGEKDDGILLGSVSLEVLGFTLDPFKRELRPMRGLLATQHIGARRSRGAEGRRGVVLCCGVGLFSEPAMRSAITLKKGLDPCQMQ